MRDPTSYRPDYSLLHAVLVLLGGVGVAAAGLYLVTAFEVPGSQWHGEPMAQAQVEAPNRVPPRGAPSVGQTRSGDFRSGGLSSWEGVPAWAESEPRPTPPMRPAPQASYQIDPDFGHAQLGVSPPSGGAPPGAGAAVADAGKAAGDASSAGRAPPAVNLGSTSPGGTASDGGTEWHADARALAGRSRALSRALGRLGQERSDAARSASASASGEGGTSGEASTASGGRGARSNSAPGTPDDPDQVPLGGAEWLAAAGAAYALNRLRKEEDDDSEDEA